LKFRGRVDRHARQAKRQIIGNGRPHIADSIRASRKAVMTVESKSLNTDLKAGKMTFDDFLEITDYAVIEDASLRAERTVSPDLATTFSARANIVQGNS